ncbi:MAG: ACP S-malonyltransferase [Clostridia bacterium]|nr:ACP S-malonyltransferase [Clostridia bacterium]
MANIAFVFSGQGAQYPGMGESLSRISPAAAALYDRAEALRPGIRALSFSGTAEELKETVNTQPALYLTDLAAALALKEAGIEPAAAAGFSLGELPALALSGAISADEGFSLVLERARLMAKASHDMPDTPAMAAVLRLSPEEIEAIVSDIDGVWCANYNAPEQTVISGTATGVAAFRAACEKAGIGARLVDLPVSGAFHTPYMKEASEAFAAVLEKTAFRAPAIPVYANLTGERYPDDPAAFAPILSAQIMSPVRWVKEIRGLIAGGIDTFVECGPGKTLCGLIKKIDKSVAVLGVENEETLAAAVAALKS